MSFRVFVDGHEGTTGLRIHEYLAERADIELLVIDSDKRKDAAERARLLNAADVAFLCLPDAAAKEAVALITNPNNLRHRRQHRAPHRSPAGPSACPSWHADSARQAAIRQTKRIANPGCHASAPSSWRCARWWMPAWCRSRCTHQLPTAITGYSGGGKSP